MASSAKESDEENYLESKLKQKAFMQSKGKTELRQIDTKSKQSADPKKVDAKSKL